MTVTLICGDAIQELALLPGESVQCCVTSPPYFGLRDYGVDGQLGLEATPEAYVEGMVAVMRAVRRVLRTDGTLWLNIGDSYAGSGKGPAGNFQSAAGCIGGGAKTYGAKQKDLLGIPWMLAFALRADGWYLRSDIIWAKPNPMPESVKDRPTRSHEYLFLLAKSRSYYYDQDAVREPVSNPSPVRKDQAREWQGVPLYQPNRGGRTQEPKKVGAMGTHPLGRNRRDVWTINTKPFAAAHFATFPEKLVEPCILAGSRPGDTVLDPFSGAATVSVVASRLGRDSIGIDLSETYCAIAAKRLGIEPPDTVRLAA